MRFSKKAMTQTPGSTGGFSSSLGSGMGAAAGATQGAVQGFTRGVGQAVGRHMKFPFLTIYLIFALLIHIADIMFFNFAFVPGRIMIHAGFAFLTFFFFMVGSSQRPPKLELFVKVAVVFAVNMAVPALLNMLTEIIFPQLQGQQSLLIAFGGVLSVWFLPIWMYYGLFFQEYLEETFFPRLLGIMIIFILLFFAPLYGLYRGGYLETYIDDGAGEEQKSMARAYWQLIQEMWVKAPELKDSLVEGAQTKGQQFWNKTLHPDVDTRVENSQGQDVGVYMENIDLVGGEPYTHHPLILRSVIRAKTFDKDIDMTLVCSAQKTYVETGKKNKVYSGQVDDPYVRVSSMQSRPFVCEFPEHTFDKGGHRVYFNASFDFATSAIIKRYVMDKARFYSMKSQDIDIFENYEISDRNPQSIYTPGPIILGIKTLDPFILLSSNQTERIRLQVQLKKEYGWEGNLQSLQNLYIFVPDGFTMEKDVSNRNKQFSCTHQVEAVEEYTDICQCGLGAICIPDCENYNIYRVNTSGLMVPKEDEEDMKTVKYVLPEDIFIGCWLEADRSTRILGNNPLDMVSFKTYAEYRFTVKEEKYVNMKKLEGVAEPGRQLQAGFCGKSYLTPKSDFGDEMTLEGPMWLPPYMEHYLEQMDVCPTLVTAIIYQNGYETDSSAGCYDGVCGTTGFTEEMYTIVAADLANQLEKDSSDHLTEAEKQEMIATLRSLGFGSLQEQKDDDFIGKLSPLVSGKYIEKELLPNCKNSQYPVECIIGKHTCGTCYAHEVESSCGSRHYYCSESFIPGAISYAYAFEKEWGTDEEKK